MPLVDYVDCPKCGERNLRVQWRADVKNPDSRKFEDCNDDKPERSPNSDELLDALNADRLIVICRRCFYSGPYRTFVSRYGISGFGS